MIKVNTVLNKYLDQQYLGDSEKRKAARSIKNLLGQIDKNAEVVPENNLDMFSRLITSLKNGEITKEENKIIKEIVDHKIRN